MECFLGTVTQMLLRVLVCLFVLQGCGVRAPMATFKGATVTESTPDAIAIQAEFEISNTNDEPLELKLYEYTVFSGGHTLYRGVASAQQTVPRWATIHSSIPIVIRRDAIPFEGRVTWQLSGSLGYIPPTALAETLLKSGLSKPATSIRAHGAFDISLID